MKGKKQPEVDSSSLYESSCKGKGEPYIVECQLAPGSIQVAILLSGLPLLVSWWWLESTFKAFDIDGTPVLVNVWFTLVFSGALGLSGFHLIGVFWPQSWLLVDLICKQLASVLVTVTNIFVPWCTAFWQSFSHTLQAPLGGQGAAPRSSGLDYQASALGKDHSFTEKQLQRQTSSQEAQNEHRKLSDVDAVAVTAEGTVSTAHLQADHPKLTPHKRPSDDIQAKYRTPEGKNEGVVTAPEGVALSLPVIEQVSQPRQTIVSEIEDSEGSSQLHGLIDLLKKSNSLPDIAAALFAAAERLLSKPGQVEPFLDYGGLQVVLQQLTTVHEALSSQQPSADATSAALQLSWVLLLLSNGSITAKDNIICPESTFAGVRACSALPQYVQFLHTVTDADHLAEEVRSTILRNISWALFVLCDSAGQLPGESQLAMHRRPQAAAAIVCLHDLGVLPLLGQQLSMLMGPGPAPYAAALLAVICQQEDLGAASKTACQLLMTSDCLHGLCYVMSASPLAERCRIVLMSLVHYLLTRHASAFVRQLVEQHLLGSYLRATSRELAHVLLCCVINAEGQAQLEDIEKLYELDVPLALAQAIPADCHVVLPPPPADPNIPDADQLLPATCTCALTSRLLLVGTRLPELCTMVFDDLSELVAPQEGPEQPAQQPAVLPETVQAAQGLLDLLMREELEIQQFKHLRGHMDDSTDSASSQHGGSTLDECLPLQSGVGQEGSPSVEPAPVWGDAPAQLAAASGGSVGGGAAAEGPRGPRTRVVHFAVGGRRVTLPHDVYTRLKASSSLLHSVLSKSSKGGAVDVLRVPWLDDEGNFRAFSGMVQWATVQKVEGLTPAAAHELWTAADFYQVDGLQSHCEDVIAQSLAAPELLSEALELAVSYPMRGDRLLNLCARHIMHHLPALLGQPHFTALIRQHRQALERGFLMELRDRLVALCALNGGVGLAHLPNVRHL